MIILRRNARSTRNWGLEMKLTLNWRGNRDLGDEMGPIAWKGMDLDEFVLDLVGEALDLDGNPSS